MIESKQVTVKEIEAALLMENLEVGFQYKCTLSNRAVLITVWESELKKDNDVYYTHYTVKGLVYNSITGRYDAINVVDYMLTPIK